MEYWKLRELNSLIQIYAEIKDDIWHIVNLHRSMKVARIGIPYVLKLLRVANEDLPGFQKTCDDLRTEINSLEDQVQNSRAILRELHNQITEQSSTAEHYRTSGRQEQVKLHSIRQKRTKEEVLVKNFLDTNEQYMKIRSIAEEKVCSTLPDSKVLLKYVLLSLVESMKKDPDTFTSFQVTDISIGFVVYLNQ
jgi:chromosome segregation ATPase